MVDLKDGVAVVTGAGSGLGRELSLALMGQGVRVAGLGRRLEPLDSLHAAHPDQFLGVPADVGDADAVGRAFERIEAESGPVNILINNAAVYPHRDILDETPQSFAQTMSINLGGAFACCHYALKGMVDRGYGRIINVVSFADRAPAPVSAAYSVSKGAQRILTRSLIADLGDRFPDIVINDWIPGALSTPMGIEDGLDPAISAGWGARLALWHDPALTGAVFVRDHEHLQPVSLKRRIMNKLTGEKPVMRKLS